MVLAFVLAVTSTAGGAQFGRPVLLASTSLRSLGAVASHGSRRSASHENSVTPILVHFNQQCTNETKAMLVATPGVQRLLNYVPHDSWLILARFSAVSALRRLPHVVFVSELQAVHKISLELHQLCGSSFQSDSHFGIERTTLLGATVHAGADMSSLVHRLQKDIAASDEWLVADGVLTVSFRSNSTARLCSALEYISAQREVLFVARQREVSMQNLVAAKVTQGGGQLITKIWNMGLHGEGQIVGIGDTGIDFDNCFFRDDERSVPIDSVDLSHRKVVAYWTEADGYDEYEGHGTHVAGSVVGQTLSTDTRIGRLNGVAWAARIAFTDVDPLTIPGNLNSQYFERPYGVGARVHSDSWGSESNAYDTRCQTLDEFVYGHDDFLSVTAAGNYGPGAGSVSAPCVAKNTLCVGAQAYSVRYIAAVRQSGSLRGSYEIKEALFGIMAAFLDRQVLNLVVAEPADACSPLVNNVPLKGKVVLVQRGACEFLVKARAVEAKGAAMLLLADDRPNGIVIMEGRPGSDLRIDIPCFSVSQSTGQQLLNLMAIDSSIELELPIVDVTQQGVASFSSRGPALDGRIKPDMLAPGSDINSVRSDGSAQTEQCGIHRGLEDFIMSTKGGTSMAAPIAAGCALLVRQYYTEGYHTKLGPFAPSAALMKGTIIHSAQGDGSVNSESGFGSIDLSRALRFEGSSFFDLFVLDQSVRLNTNERFRTCVVTKAAGSKLKATLVWTDRPGTVLASVALVNDLDLTIFGPSKGQAQFEWVGNQAGKYDRLNNVEQITIPATEYGSYTIQVIAHNIPDGPQNFALVVTGVFEEDPSCEATVQPLTQLPTLNPTTPSPTTPSPTSVPTHAPSVLPSDRPTTQPTVVPTTLVPTTRPSPVPTVVPSLQPSYATPMPTVTPTPRPSYAPTPSPTFYPTSSRPSSSSPSSTPSLSPSPVLLVTTLPTSSPSVQPTWEPTAAPSIKPTSRPTQSRTTAPPTTNPTLAPVSARPTLSPTRLPTKQQLTSVPTKKPSMPVTRSPTVQRSWPPFTLLATPLPSAVPLPIPTTLDPTSIPSSSPTMPPSSVLTTATPTSALLSTQPTLSPTTTTSPTQVPSDSPTALPTRAPVMSPTPSSRTEYRSAAPTVATSAPTNMGTAVLGAPIDGPIELLLEVDESVEYFNNNARALSVMRQTIATMLGLSYTRIKIEVQAGSVILKVTIEPDASESISSTEVAQLSTILQSIDLETSFAPFKVLQIVQPGRNESITRTPKSSSSTRPVVPSSSAPLSTVNRSLIRNSSNNWLGTLSPSMPATMQISTRMPSRDPRPSWAIKIPDTVTPLAPLTAAPTPVTQAPIALLPPSGATVAPTLPFSTDPKENSWTWAPHLIQVNTGATVPTDDTIWTITSPPSPSPITVRTAAPSLPLVDVQIEWTRAPTQKESSAALMWIVLASSILTLVSVIGAIVLVRRRRAGQEYKPSTGVQVIEPNELAAPPVTPATPTSSERIVNAATLKQNMALQSSLKPPATPDRVAGMDALWSNHEDSAQNNDASVSPSSPLTDLLNVKTNTSPQDQLGPRAPAELKSSRPRRAHMLSHSLARDTKESLAYTPDRALSKSIPADSLEQVAADEPPVGKQRRRRNQNRSPGDDQNVPPPPPSTTLCFTQPNPVQQYEYQQHLNRGPPGTGGAALHATSPNLAANDGSINMLDIQIHDSTKRGSPHEGAVAPVPPVPSDLFDAPPTAPRSNSSSSEGGRTRRKKSQQESADPNVLFSAADGSPLRQEDGSKSRRKKMQATAAPDLTASLPVSASMAGSSSSGTKPPKRRTWMRATTSNSPKFNNSVVPLPAPLPKDTGYSTNRDHRAPGFLPPL